MPEVEMQTEKAKLNKTLRRWDMALFTACAIIGFDSLAYTTAVGLGQAITWLIITFFIFLIPFGFLTAEVSAAFPAEGGIYAWCRMCFGKLFGEPATMMYWLSNAIWLGGTLTAVTIGVIDVFFTPKHPLNTWESIVVGLVFTWVTILLSVINLKYGKWTGNLGTPFKGIIMVVLGVLAILFLVRHGIPKGVAPASLTYRASPASSRSSASSSSSGSASSSRALPVRRWSTRRRTYLGPSSALGSSRPPCTSSSCCVCCSCSPRRTSAVPLASRPPCRPSSAARWAAVPPRTSAISWASSSSSSTCSSASVWTLGSARVQAVAALDGSAPRLLGKFSKQGTPLPMCILMGIVGSVMCVIIFLVTSGSLKSFITVMIALDTSLTVVVYVFVIPAIVRLRTTHAHVHRPFVVPGGAAGLWACAAITWILSVITCITLLWPGLINNMLGQSFSITSYEGMSRARFEIFTLGTFAVLMLIGVAFWAYGRTQGKVSDDAVIEGVVEEDA